MVVILMWLLGIKIALEFVIEDVVYQFRSLRFLSFH